MSRTIFAVIADEKSTELTRFIFNRRLTELSGDDIKIVVEMLADNNCAWKSVLKGRRVAMICDPKTGDKISINCSHSVR